MVKWNLRDYDILETIYSTSFAQGFYKPKEVERFMKKRTSLAFKSVHASIIIKLLSTQAFIYWSQADQFIPQSCHQRNKNQAETWMKKSPSMVMIKVEILTLQLLGKMHL